MPQLVERIWPADPSAAGGRSARQAFSYYAYLPDPIAGMELLLPGPLARDVAAAERELAQLQGQASFLGLEALSRQLLRAESVASSRIEGLSLSQRRMAQALFDPKAADATARAVLGNVKAMEQAIAIGDSADRITVDHLLGVHAALFEGTGDQSMAGQLRSSQNWIGGNSHSPRNAEFIPPPEDQVPSLLEDLCDFLAREDMPGLIQAAIAHAQFETIHPFADGNGRVGRALIHVVLRRRQLVPSVVPPVSMILATNAARYIDGLTRFRSGHLLDWCAMFMATMQTAIARSEELAAQLGDLQERWRSAAGHPRRDSTAEKLIRAFPGRPILDGKIAASLAGVSDEAARTALLALEEAGVLRPVVLGKKRNRAWEAPEVIELLDTFEWHLATPTRSEQPRRPSPRPRRSKGTLP
jgi:Fic family protein